MLTEGDNFPDEMEIPVHPHGRVKIYRRNRADERGIKYTYWKDMTEKGHGLTDNGWVIPVSYVSKVMIDRMKPELSARHFFTPIGRVFSRPGAVINFDPTYSFLPSMRFNTIKWYLDLKHNNRHLSFIETFFRFFKRTLNAEYSARCAYLMIYTGNTRKKLKYAMVALEILISDPEIRGLYMQYVEDVLKEMHFDWSLVVKEMLDICSDKSDSNRFEALKFMFGTLKEIATAREEREKPAGFPQKMFGGIMGVGDVNMIGAYNKRNGNNKLELPDDPDKALAMLNAQSEDSDPEIKGVYDDDV